MLAPFVTIKLVQAKEFERLKVKMNSHAEDKRKCFMFEYLGHEFNNYCRVMKNRHQTISKLVKTRKKIPILRDFTSKAEFF